MKVMGVTSDTSSKSFIEVDGGSIVLSGQFENCYGLRQFHLPNIDFRRCNGALIYAPNGVMKALFQKSLTIFQKARSQLIGFFLRL